VSALSAEVDVSSKILWGMFDIALLSAVASVVVDCCVWFVLILDGCVDGATGDGLVWMVRFVMVFLVYFLFCVR
jgi:hypothetical protein